MVVLRRSRRAASTPQLMDPPVRVLVPVARTYQMRMATQALERPGTAPHGGSAGPGAAALVAHD
eukprot:3652768-Alexandrium_andersonii.AAC.1